MIAYAAIQPVVRENIPDATSLTLVYLLIYMELLINILFLARSVDSPDHSDAAQVANSNFNYHRWGWAGHRLAADGSCVCQVQGIFDLSQLIDQGILMGWINSIDVTVYNQFSIMKPSCFVVLMLVSLAVGELILKDQGNGNMGTGTQDTVTGQDSKWIGNQNQIEGKLNQVQGNGNIVQGNGNVVGGEMSPAELTAMEDIITDRMAQMLLSSGRGKLAPSTSAVPPLSTASTSSKTQTPAQTSQKPTTPTRPDAHISQQKQTETKAKVISQTHFSQRLINREPFELLFRSYGKLEENTGEQSGIQDYLAIEQMMRREKRQIENKIRKTMINEYAKQVNNMSPFFFSSAFTKMLP